MSESFANAWDWVQDQIFGQDQAEDGTNAGGGLLGHFGGSAEPKAEAAIGQPWSLFGSQRRRQLRSQH